MSPPFVSVLIDTYNHEKFIEQAVTSVLEQSISPADFEILVVDDGSTDRTPDLVKKFAPRVTYLPKKNGGQASAFNFGIPQCRGEIIAFLDADDWWLPDKLARILQAFETNPAVGMVGHGIINSFPDRQLTISLGRTELLQRDNPRYAEAFRLRRAFLGTSRLALRAALARRILPVPEALLFEADEYLFSLAAAFSDFMILADPLTCYRIHGANLFVAAGGNSAGLRRKQKVLHALLDSLRRALTLQDVSPQFAAAVLEIVALEESQLRLMLDGGSPLETYRTETAIYRIQHADAPLRSRFFRTLSMVPALLLPARSFYAARRWLASQTWYKRARQELVPIPGFAVSRSDCDEKQFLPSGSPAYPHDSLSSRKHLKARLKEFWSGQELYWSLLTEEIAKNSQNRAKAAAFVPMDSRILDVACGRAANRVWLLERGSYFGADLSTTGLTHARKEGVLLACADAELLPFADESFDATVATYALEHSVEPRKMLQEMARVVRSDGRIILLGPSWDFPFWFPNSLRTRATSPWWRLRYTTSRALRQFVAILGGPSPFLIVEEPDALAHPFVEDADAVYVMWSYEVVRHMRLLGCRLIHAEVDNRLLGLNPIVRLFKRALFLLPAYKYAGSTTLLVFAKSTSA